jgi:hypothetical protein
VPHATLVELPAGHLVIGEMAADIGALVLKHTS